MDFDNTYDDALRAETYAKLEFHGTYYLAYRDLPRIIFDHVKGRNALDFGCGTGRSTRFLKKLGFKTIGIDISKEMLSIAMAKDPEGTYFLVVENDFSPLKEHCFDLVLSVFAFDNLPKMQNKVNTFTKLGNSLKDTGVIINIVSSPEIYKHEWTSFSTKDFPENCRAKCGDKVKIIITDTNDKRPVEDIIWPDEEYKKVYKQAGLEVINTYKPLATNEEPYKWVNETEIAPWVIYILKKSE